MSEQLFGRVYETVGSSSSDLLLKTKGQLKVKWGNKYIDLIKDGQVAYPKESVQKLIEQIVEEKSEKLPSNVVLLYEGNEAPEFWTQVDLDTGIQGYIYIKKMN